jgi:hypothetical protein
LIIFSSIVRNGSDIRCNNGTLLRARASKFGLSVQVVDDLLVWFSASHAGYLDLEFGVLFYSPYVEAGEALRL